MKQHISVLVNKLKINVESIMKEISISIKYEMKRGNYNERERFLDI